MIAPHERAATCRNRERNVAGSALLWASFQHTMASRAWLHTKFSKGRLRRPLSLPTPMRSARAWRRAGQLPGGDLPLPGSVSTQVWRKPSPVSNRLSWGPGFRRSRRHSRREPWGQVEKSARR